MIDRTVSLIRLQMVQIDNIVELSGEVGRTGDEEGLLQIKGNLIDLLLMREEFIYLLPRKGIVETNGPIVKGNEEGLVQIQPDNVGRLDHLAIGHFGQINLQPWNIGEGIAVLQDTAGSIINGYLRIMIHEGIVDRGEHIRSVGPGDAPDGSVVGEGVDDLPRLAVPEVDGCVGGGGDEAGGESVDVEVPDGSLVAVEGSNAFAAFGPPHRGNVIFGPGEEEVTIVIVFYDCY
mmetsp:Transcript_18729/g.27354  ORF Transcript_18729/g.27354 Transcript_18729/m.27354 type:complete len:233 (-) Transcript_18729:159-857(-)